MLGIPKISPKKCTKDLFVYQSYQSLLFLEFIWPSVCPTTFYYGRIILDSYEYSHKPEVNSNSTNGILHKYEKDSWYINPCNKFYEERKTFTSTFSHTKINKRRRGGEGLVSFPKGRNDTRRRTGNLVWNTKVVSGQEIKEDRDHNTIKHCPTVNMFVIPIPTVYHLLEKYFTTTQLDVGCCDFFIL